MEKSKPFILTVAWMVTILCSTLPDILYGATGNPLPYWWAWFQILLPVTLLLLSFRLLMLKSLRLYFLFLAVYLLLWRAVNVIRALPRWQTLEAGTTWVAGISAIQGLKLSIALILLVGLFFILRDRGLFFFTTGNLKTAAQPVRWLGMKTPDPWLKFGAIIAAFILFGGILFLWLSNQPSTDQLVATLPLLPFIILISATNAFSEEAMFRSALLAPLCTGLSKPAALAMISVFFGLAHYSGSFPSGFIWVLLTGFLGFLFGKAMLETRGLLAPWLLHFISDIPVFFFTAVFSMNF